MKSTFEKVFEILESLMQNAVSVGTRPSLMWRRQIRCLENPVWVTIWDLQLETNVLTIFKSRFKIRHVFLGY